MQILRCLSLLLLITFVIGTLPSEDDEGACPGGVCVGGQDSEGWHDNTEEMHQEDEVERQRQSICRAVGHQAYSFSAARQGSKLVELDEPLSKTASTIASVVPSVPFTCWCLDAIPVSAWWNWGKTRVFKIRPYDPMSLQLWVGADEDAVSLLFEQSLQEDTWFMASLRSVGISSHSCSVVSNRTECVVRASPFAGACAGVRGRQRRARLQVTVEFQTSTWVPLLLALLLFLSAPPASRSLVCYYSAGALLSSVLCVGIVVFWVSRKVMSPRKAIFVGVLSWGGAVFQGMARELVYSKWSALFLATSGLIGFLFAYNYPPSQRMQFSVQLLFQFVSVVVVVLTAPSVWREGAVVLSVMALAQLYLFLRPVPPPPLAHTQNLPSAPDITVLLPTLPPYLLSQS